MCWFISRNVSPEVAEAIHQVIGACGVVKPRQPPPPPGVLRPQRGLDTFSASSVFSSGVDTLNSGIAGISLATSSAFSLPAGKLLCFHSFRLLLYEVNSS